MRVTTASVPALKTSVFTYPDADSGHRVASASPKRDCAAPSCGDALIARDFRHGQMYTNITCGLRGWTIACSPFQRRPLRHPSRRRPESTRVDVVAIELVRADVALRAMRSRRRPFVVVERRRTIRRAASRRHVVCRAAGSDRKHRQRERRGAVDAERSDQRIGGARAAALRGSELTARAMHEIGAGIREAPGSLQR